MSATGRTTNYGFGIYSPNDTTSWLSTFNPNMVLIDSTIKEISEVANTSKTTADSAKNVANNAQELADRANTSAIEANTKATNALNKAYSNETLLNVHEEEIGKLNTNALEEVVTIPNNIWVENTSDARYPYSASISCTLDHNKPTAYPYGGNNLLTDEVLNTVASIPQFLYNTENRVITFYTTLSDVSSIIELSFVVRG